jgi:3-isopropylmalate/(R)-2-methylmalate dehydratase small subunit
MNPVNRIAGIAAALPMPNIDTDQIMPKQFLKNTDKSGLVEGLFHDLRRRGNGSLDPDFVLNRPEWRMTAILAAGPNFGCGSSREHAVWGLMQAGIRCVIAESFANIFAGNALKNGLLLVRLPGADIQQLLQWLQAPEPRLLRVDLPAQRVEGNGYSAGFTIPAVHKAMLLQGVDQIEVTMTRLPEIVRHEQTLGIASA